MMLDKAKCAYQGQIANVRSLSAKIHLQTNMCESFCFFDSEEFDELYDETLRQAKKFQVLQKYRKTLLFQGYSSYHKA